MQTTTTPPFDLQSSSGKTQEHAFSCDLTRRLPTELLRSIFLEARHSAESLEWMSFSWVCRRWREIALQDPSLWTQVSVWEDSDVDMLGDLLNRTKSMGVDLKIDGRMMDLNRPVTMVVGHANHLSTLALTFGYSQLPLIQLMLGTAMPGLTELDLQAVGSKPTAKDNTMLYMDHQHLPALRVLSTYGFIARTPPAMLKELTTLKVLNMLNCTRLYPQDKFKDYMPLLLALCPKLRELALGGIPCPASETRPIQLPKLEKLELDGAAPWQLMPFFRLRPTVKLSVRSHWTTQQIVRSHLVLNTAIRHDHIQKSAPAFLQTKAVRLTVGHTIMLSGDLQGNPAAEQPSWRMEVIPIPHIPDYVDMLPMTMRELPYFVNASLVVDLSLHLRIRRDQQRMNLNIVPALNRFPNLRTLVIGGATAVKTLKDSKHWRIAPSLRRLTFCLPGPMMVLSGCVRTWRDDLSKRHVSVVIPETFRNYEQDTAPLNDMSGCAFYHSVPIHWEWAYCECCHSEEEWKMDRKERMELASSGCNM